MPDSDLDMCGCGCRRRERCVDCGYDMHGDADCANQHHEFAAAPVEAAPEEVNP